MHKYITERCEQGRPIQLKEGGKDTLYNAVGYRRIERTNMIELDLEAVGQYGNK